MRVNTGCVVVVVLRCVFRELTSCPDQGPEGGGRKSIDRYERPLTSTGIEHYRALKTVGRKTKID